MGGVHRCGPPRLSPQVGTYSVIGNDVLQLRRWEPFFELVINLKYSRSPMR